MVKTCKRCNTEKGLDSFSVSQSNKDGYSCVCKPCVSERNKEYWRTPKGRISSIFATQVSSSKQRKHVLPKYTREELLEWAYQNNLLTLHQQWEKSGYLKDYVPSIDRLDPTKEYSLDNIRLVTWKENNEKAYEDRKTCRHITKQNRRIRQLDMTGKLLSTFNSISSASRLTGITRININDVCRKKAHCKSAGGYIWEYVD